MFFVIALIAAAFGFLGIAAAAVSIAKVLFYIFLILFLVSLIGGLLRRNVWTDVKTNLTMQRGVMKSSSIVGILLIILGVVALAYQGITYTTHKRVLDIGPIQATKEEHKTIPLPLILGGLALVGGVALLISGNKNA
jgi:uncharacterized membrane protein YtjA (UPF0391 family)